MADPWIPPADIEAHCSLCPAVRVGVEAIVRHLVIVHGQPEPERWPDGGIAWDGSEIVDEVVSGG